MDDNDEMIRIRGQEFQVIDIADLGTDEIGPMVFYVQLKLDWEKIRENIQSAAARAISWGTMDDWN